MFLLLIQQMKAFLEIKFVMRINKLLSLEDYWSTNKCIGNEKIQNVMTRTRFQFILRNFHFSNNDNDIETCKSNKIRPVIEPLNKVFAESLSNRNNILRILVTRTKFSFQQK